MKVKLTAKTLEALTLATYRGELADEASPGLRVRVTPGGLVAFSFLYVFKGRRQRIALGIDPDLSLADAREDADAYRAAVRQGRDPQDPPSRSERAEGGRRGIHGPPRRGGQAGRRPWRWCRTQRAGRY